MRAAGGGRGRCCRSDVDFIGKRHAQAPRTPSPRGGEVPPQQVSAGTPSPGSLRDPTSPLRGEVKHPLPYGEREKKVTRTCRRARCGWATAGSRSEEHTSELQSRFGISYA